MSAARIELLVLVIVAVALVARWIRVPYTVGLLGAGVVLGLLPGNEELHLSRELVFSFLLPPLVYEAAINIRWKDLRQELVLVGVLATVGLAIAAGIVCFGMQIFLKWPIAVAATFAVLISATDPVSVIAAFKDAKSDGRHRLLVESESLLNDGTAAAGFALALTAAMGGHVSGLQFVGQFVLAAVGGLVIGALIGGFGLIVSKRTDDHLVEIAITVAVAYGAFLVAEQFHLSGVLATVAAGLMAGKYGSSGLISERGRAELESFWEVIAFAANSVVFLLMGVRETRVSFSIYVFPASIAVLLVLVGRAASTYGLAALFSRSRWRIPLIGQHLLFWGGLRGALALALVLGLPQDFPKREEIMSVTFAVVGFSVLAQGLSIKPLILKASND